MAQGDLTQFDHEAMEHAQKLKRVMHEAKQLRDYWDKLDLVNSTETLGGPRTHADLINYATLCGALMDFLDNVAVAQGDRRQVMERIATDPVAV